MKKCKNNDDSAETLILASNYNEFHIYWFMENVLIYRRFFCGNVSESCNESRSIFRQIYKPNIRHKIL